MVSPLVNTNLRSDQLTLTLPLQVANHIGAQIVEGTFAPGERLKETFFAEAFNVSRATVREALRILHSRGLVRVLPQRGAQVTQLSGKELDDFFEIRAVLLGLGSRRAAALRSDADLALLRERLNSLEASLDDLDAYFRASGVMVAEVMRISGSLALVAYIEEFALRIGRYVRLGLTSSARRRTSVREWRRLVAAIELQDGDLAEKCHRQLALTNRQAALNEFRRLASASEEEFVAGRGKSPASPRRQ